MTLDDKLAWERDFALGLMNKIKIEFLAVVMGKKLTYITSETTKLLQFYYKAQGIL